jgi:dipeptidyl aminopeptidase/acylaminoacyl peptidase
VVDLYSGTRSNFLNTFGFDPFLIQNGQLYASRGYGFFQPDLFVGQRDPMRQFAGETISAVNQLIQRKIADPNRIALLGHSYGGYAVLSVLSQSQQFKTGICLSGVSNLTSDYNIFIDDNGTPEWDIWEETLGGTLWEKRQTYIENSPIFYLDKVQCPVLLACGTGDYSATKQLDEAYNALRRLGRRVELRKYVGEPHCYNEWSQETVKDLLTRILEWLDENLKKDVSTNCTNKTLIIGDKND